MESVDLKPGSQEYFSGVPIAVVEALVVEMVASCAPRSLLNKTNWRAVRLLPWLFAVQLDFISMA